MPRHNHQNRSRSRSDIRSTSTSEAVTPEALRLWLRRAKRKFRHGIPIVKIQSSGKLVRRVMFVGAKKEYLELISNKVFDVSCHLTEVESMKHGVDSDDFRAYISTNTDESRIPRENRSLVITAKCGILSLVFSSEADRRDCEFLLRAERKGIADRYDFIAAEFENRLHQAGL